ncbi:tryptophan transporter [Bacillus litorisediminis]|uniref:tryptophan transporter n=1 Tax=Bacillus litorisediminis TaxID=2922713 RepID=UPI001FAE5E0E|nr:tryptophan transporter [Bacillus litorisediminis]
MKTKELVLLALLIAMGAVLHIVVPPFIGGMKPDLLLIMMFLGIILFPRVGNVLLVGLAAGIISALTTGFPGGQIPNIIDKLVTAFIFFALFIVLNKIAAHVATVTILTAIGTFISGMIFLGSAFILFGLPDAFLALATGVVLPAVGLNAVFMLIIYPIALKLSGRLQLQAPSTQAVIKK